MTVEHIKFSPSAGAEKIILRVSAAQMLLSYFLHISYCSIFFAFGTRVCLALRRIFWGVRGSVLNDLCQAISIPLTSDST